MRVTARDGLLTVTVEDDGRGLAEHGPGGRGLANMQARADELGRHAQSRPGAGRHRDLPHLGGADPEARVNGLPCLAGGLGVLATAGTSAS